MDKKKFRLRANSDFEVEAIIPLRYSFCKDGYVIYGGTLPGSGFQPYYCDGITLPEEIDGIPVTELRGTYKNEKIGYIESPCLKRIFICIEGSDSYWSNHEFVCNAPMLCGGLQETLETMELVFQAKEMRIGSFSENHALTNVSFIGKVLDNPDWDYGSYNQGIFKGCENLKYVSGNFEGWCLSGSTFEGCKSLISIPDIRVKYLSDREFYGCESLSTIHLHNGLKSIGSSAFENCRSLKDMYIPDTVSEFGSFMFRNCIQLESVHLPDTMTEIQKGMFYGCSRLQKIFLSDDINNIGEEAFMGCGSLKKLWIPKNLVSIGKRAFCGCISISTIVIPNSVKMIGEDAFKGCSKLTIKCCSGSVAHQYAQKNGIPFLLF